MFRLTRCDFKKKKKKILKSHHWCLCAPPWGLCLSSPKYRGSALGTLSFPVSAIGDSSSVPSLGTLFLFPLSAVGDSSSVPSLGTLSLSPKCRR